jgi:hypothetical protein
MAFEYPGEYNFGGITTDVEIANLINLRRARMNARMATEEPQQEEIPQSNIIDDIPIPQQEEIISPTNAIIALLHSQPITALDWIIIIIVLISFACFIQRLAKYGRHKSHRFVA